MQFKHWKTCVTTALLGSLALPGSVLADSSVPATLVGMDTNASHVVKGEKGDAQLARAVLLKLSVNHACGSNELYMTPDSIGVPADNFGRVIERTEELIEDQTPFIITLSACDGQRAMATRFDPCTPEACAAVAAKPVDGKLYLDEDYSPVTERGAEYVLQVPMPYDKEHKAWKAKIYTVSNGKLRLDGYVNNEDFAQGNWVYPYKVYRNNGKVGLSVGLDAKGLYQGKTIHYHENGKVEKTLVYRDNKVVDGEYITYDENGKIASRMSYKNGEMDGPYLEYFPNGKVSHSGPFVGGKKHGPVTDYYENGATKHTATYVENSPEGWSIRYYPDGKTEAKNLNQDGVQRSLADWNAQGVQIRQWQWDEQHQKQGEFKEWYDNGQLKELKVYKDDKLNGQVQTWYEDGKPESAIDYVNGAEQGWSRAWKQDGSLNSECQYQAGERLGECRKP